MEQNQLKARPHCETSDSCGEGSSNVTLKNVEESIEASTSMDKKECSNHSTSLHPATNSNSSVESSNSSADLSTFAKLYPPLYNTFQEDAKKLGIDLSSIFPGSAEGLKSKLNKLNSEGADSSKIAELTDALATVLSLTVSNEHEKVPSSPFQIEGSSNIKSATDDKDVDDESFPDDCSSSSASMSNTNNSKNCSCCFGGHSASVSQNYPEMRERLRSLLAKKKKEKQSAMSKSMATANVSKDKTRAITPPCVVDELLDFIEGNQKCTNEKKKAKKERQKQKKIEELKKKEEEETKRKEAIEAERKQSELEVKKQQEAERLMMKKQRKKAAQKAKKAAAKGISLDNQQQKSSMSSMDQLKMQKIKEIERRKMMLQQEVEEQERKLEQLLHETGGGQADMKLANVNGMHFKPSFPPAAAPSSKGPKVKITRTSNGSAQFTQVGASEVTEQAFRPTRTPFAPMQAAQSTTLGLSFITNQQPAIPPSAKTNSNTPMVTIRRVQGGDCDNPTVTISSNDSKSKSSYTFIKGQVSKHATENLIPNAKPGIPRLEAKRDDGKLSKNQKKKLKKLSRSGSNKEAPTTCPSTVAPPSPMMSQPVQHLEKLPTTEDGKVDLDRLQLPFGTSITRIKGPVPERKYSPMLNPSTPKVQSSFGTNNTLGSMNGGSKSGEQVLDYQTMPTVGYPSIKDLDVNGSKLIVVDASYLASNDEAETSKKGKKKNKNNKSKTSPENDGINANREQSPFTNSSYMSGSRQELLFKPKIPVQEQSKSNSMKSDPQVKIKNINGKVVITPVPGIGATLPNPSSTDQPNNIMKGECTHTNEFVSDVK